MQILGDEKRRIGRYELHALIGEGGMGRVYRGIDTKTGRAVAIKVVNVPDDIDVAEKLRRRFLREVLAVSRVAHPNVVQVHDYGVADDDAPYLVMELLEGTDLRSVVRQSRRALAVSFVADIALEICAAVRACHAAAIIHRDLKPGNVFLAKTDAGTGWQVKVLDFGVVKSALFDEELTNVGQVVGTLQYASPEQVRGLSGPESDQYAIGVLLYTCVTKHLPFGRLTGVPLLKAIADGNFERPRTHRPDLPEQVERIILRAMNVAAGHRFESVHALGAHLWPFASRVGRRKWERLYAPASTEPAVETTTNPILSDQSGRPSLLALPTAVSPYDTTTVADLDDAGHAAIGDTRLITGVRSVPEQRSKSPQNNTSAAAPTSAACGTPVYRGVPRGLIFGAAALASILFLVLGVVRVRRASVSSSVCEATPAAAAEPDSVGGPSDDAATVWTDTQAQLPAGEQRSRWVAPGPSDASPPATTRRRPFSRVSAPSVLERDGKGVPIPAW